LARRLGECIPQDVSHQIGNATPHVIKPESRHWRLRYRRTGNASVMSAVRRQQVSFFLSTNL
jgi:hypothetical protein